VVVTLKNFMNERGIEMAMISFYLDQRSGVAPYMQIVQQVKQALLLGLLQPDDQLPTVREVVAQLAINPNTILKAYRELELEGLIASRPGIGTFVIRTIGGVDSAILASLRRTLMQWLKSAREAGLDDESIHALFTTTFQNSHLEGTA
jgi:GntR family transcriptional regulator